MAERTVEKNGIEFVVTEEYTEADIERVQQKSKAMMKTIIDILNKHNIDYMVAHGTLLGMIRHQGFIPWDDDCDLFLFDWQYARAIELLRRELPPDMMVHNRRTDPIYWPMWTKIRDIHSDTYETLWEMDRKFRYHGICIDLLRVTPSSEGEYRYGKLRDQWIRKRRNAKKKFAAIRSRKKKVKAAIKYPLRVLRFHYKIHKYDRLCKKYDKKLLIANKGTVIEGAFDYDATFPLKEYEFEGITVKGPKDPDKILRGLYGNYMELPPLESRRSHYSRVEFLDGFTI